MTTLNTISSEIALTIGEAISTDKNFDMITVNKTSRIPMKRNNATIIREMMVISIAINLKS